ncbi:WD and tetratricopeptide repeats protein 1-like [Daphnia carinata]|uniref:WD and tetratricopeptide repeats protein 1-like n=1 Tax=Daphnia carinata TaxID=120202 RepID=UPI00257D4FE1|nr:WD and tetratricopeptide repeats protein 1-like [Daphnia carinata]
MEQYKRLSNPLVIHYLKSKEINDSLIPIYQPKLSSMKSLIDRLGLDYELSGHSGCVNCLEWNKDGSVLASGSDDLHIILWNPFLKRKIASIDTGHQGNIFSVKFMPQTKDGLVASAAGDGRVKIHWVEHASAINSTPQTSLQCNCHVGRVKRLATAPDVPYLLWSGAEDGTVMQFDLRMPHACTNGPSNILINLLSHTGKQAEVKSIAINPVRTEQLVVGANDPFIRLYDRRMIKITSVPFCSERANRGRQYSLVTSSQSEESRSAIPLGCAQYFAPGHLPQKLDDYRRRFRSLASTYVTFDASGRYILANLGGEQIYLYDCLTPKLPITQVPLLDKEPFNGTDIVTLPPEIEQIKIQANAAFQQRQYTTAIGLYSKALMRAPNSPVLYSNRAAACMKRNWDGDTYAALRDCVTALKIDPNQIKPFHRLARCLLDLGQPRLADQAFQLFKEKFPQQANSSMHNKLHLEVQKKLELQEQRTERETARRQMDDESDLLEDGDTSSSITENEKIWRTRYWDYTSRYCGHCNTTTDIKEANFFGDDGQYILAGSDDGCFFIWDRHTGIVERVLRGDESIVNCLQPHPFTCMLATSGIDSVVRIWSPLPQERAVQDRLGSVVHDAESAAMANQRRMNADPFELFLMNMGATAEDAMPDITVRPRRPASSPGDDQDEDSRAAIQCRQS